MALDYLHWILDISIIIITSALDYLDYLHSLRIRYVLILHLSWAMNTCLEQFDEFVHFGSRSTKDEEADLN